MICVFDGQNGIVAARWIGTKVWFGMILIFTVGLSDAGRDGFAYQCTIQILCLLLLISALDVFAFSSKCTFLFLCFWILSSSVHSSDLIMIFAISSQHHHATDHIAPHHPVPHHWNTMHCTALLEYHSRSLFEAWAVRSQRQQTDRDCFELCQVPQPIYFSGTLSTLSFAKHCTPWYDKIRALLSQHHHHRWVRMVRAILREALGILGTKLHDGRPAPPLPHITHQTFKPHHFPPLLSNIIINQISFINF